MKMMYCRKEYKYKIIILPLFLILLQTVLSSCSGMSVQTEYFLTMDTLAESTVITKEAETGIEANERIKEICTEIENRISKTVEGSEIYQLNNFLKNQNEPIVSMPPYTLSAETVGLLETAKYMRDCTNGAFNPCLGDIIDLWGINNSDENAVHKLPEKIDFYPALERASEFYYTAQEKDVGFCLTYNLIQAPTFDLGAIGKGYAIDGIGNYLIEAGIPNALVSFGSSILAAGKNKIGNLWAVALKDPLYPDYPEKACGYISASDKVISVSGSYERFATIDGVDYCHIIDPETGYPVDNDLLCTVVIMNAPSALQTKETREKYKDNGAISDALSTALFVMGKEKALKFYNSTSLDFEMILFVKSDTPRGYEIIPTNVMFTEFEETTENERLTPKFD